MKQEKLNIIYRGSNLENPIEALRDGRPNGFDKRNSFYTLDRAIKYSKQINKVYIIIDGDRGYLSDYIQSLGYDIIYINKKSNSLSLKYCYEFAKSLDNNNIYFVEDDYWHLENALDVINEGINSFGLVTGYDHTDRYTRTDDITHNKESIKISENHYWRTAESTTCTWGISKSLYNEVFDIASTHLLEDRIFFRRLIIEKNIRLHTPIPSVSTHLMNDYISPFFKFI
jgi:hypothetical protein